jgi:hypothetical protein
MIDVDACPDAYPAEVTERHAAHPVTVDPDHLADELVAIVADPNTGTDGELEAFDVEPQPDHLGHGPGRLRCHTHARRVEPARQVGVERRLSVGR